jgi:hypothetical protein
VWVNASDKTLAVSARKAAAAAAELAVFRRELAHLPAQERVKRMMERKDTMRVVRSTPTVDLYATLREVGVEDTLELLELCSPAQIQGFLDLDGWRRDRVDARSISLWLRALFAANPDRAVGQLRGLDLELLTLLFKIHTRVYDLAEEEEPEGEVGRHTITPDNRYLIVFGGVGADDAMNATLQEAIERLQARDIFFVMRLCTAVRWELASQLEEDAYRWRNARLADLGFLPAAEAAEIVAWQDPDAPLPKVQAPAVPPPPDSDEALNTDLTTSVLLPWELLQDGGTVLGRVLGQLHDDARGRVAHELMLVANRVHCALAGDLGDSAALKDTARLVADTTGVALSYLSRGDPSALAAPLSETSVSALFRVGYSLSLKLQRDLRVRIQREDSGMAGQGLLRLDAPLREVVAGLLRPQPVLYAGLLHPRRVDFRPVSSLPELAAAAGAVAEAAFRAALLFRLGATDEVVAAAAAAAGIDDDKLAAEPPAHGQLLATAMVNAFLAKEDSTPSDPTFAPLTDIHVVNLQERLKSDSTNDMPASVRTALGAWLQPLTALPAAATKPELQGRALAYATALWGALSAELAAVTDQRADTRFLVTAWTA